MLRTLKKRLFVPSAENQDIFLQGRFWHTFWTLSLFGHHMSLTCRWSIYFGETWDPQKHNSGKGNHEQCIMKTMCARSIKSPDSSLQTQRKIQKTHLAASLLKARANELILYMKTCFFNHIFSLETKQWQITELKAKKLCTTKLNTATSDSHRRKR